MFCRKRGEYVPRGRGFAGFKHGGVTCRADFPVSVAELSEFLRMNEVFKPDVAERAAPAPPAEPGPQLEPPISVPPGPRQAQGSAAGRPGGLDPRPRGRGDPRLAEVRGDREAGARREKLGSHRNSAADRPGRAGDAGGYADHPRRARHRGPVRDGDDPHSDRRHADGARLQRRPDGQEGRLPRPDRPAALSGRARPGAGPARQGPGAARAGAKRPRTLRGVSQAGFDRQTAGRRSAGARRAGQGGDPNRPGAGANRSAQPQLHAHRVADQRPGRHPARRRWQLSAAVRLRPGSSSSPNSIRSA